MIHNIDFHGELTQAIIGAGIAVHQTTGAGLLESVYKKCMALELQARGLRVEPERPIEFLYRGRPIDTTFRADLIVEDKVLLEIKSVEVLAPIHQAQVVTYLKMTGYQVGLLFNFNVVVLRHGIRRLVHPEIYRLTHPLPEQIEPVVKDRAGSPTTDAD